MKNNSVKKSIFHLILCFIGVIFLVSARSSYVKASDTDYINAFSAYALQNGKSLYVVSKNDVPGYYHRVSDAVSAAANGDIILILPGEYEESLDTRGKDLVITGTDRNTCIIKYETNSYTAPVLNASSGMFCNLTLYGYHNGPLDQKEKDYTYLTDDNIDDYYRAYTVHIDDDAEFMSSISFNNCSIISENSNCFGLGLRDHFTLLVDNCSLRSTGENGCIYVHDSLNPAYSGSDMNMIFRNNIWEGFGGPYIMWLTSFFPTARINLTFQNVVTYCYTMDNEMLYSPLNFYSGPDARDLAGNPGICSTPVYICNSEHPRGYISGLRNNVPYDNPGIYHVISSGETESTGRSNTIFPIFMENFIPVPGSGWAGSASYYLTPDSYGNTLDIMNYHCICATMPFVQSDNMSGN